MIPKKWKKSLFKSECRLTWIHLLQNPQCWHKNLKFSPLCFYTLYTGAFWPLFPLSKALGVRESMSLDSNMQLLKGCEEKTFIGWKKGRALRAPAALLPTLRIGAEVNCNTLIAWGQQLVDRNEIFITSRGKKNKYIPDWLTMLKFGEIWKLYLHDPPVMNTSVW